MKNLFIAQQGVRGCNHKVEKKGCVTIRFADGKNSPYTVIEVDNYKGIGLNYRQRDEPLVIIHNLPDCGSDPVFAGTHQELVEELTENPQSLLETLMVISFNMGSLAYYTGDSMEDIQTAIQLANEFEEEHRDTDWTEEDWLLAIDNYSRHRIQQLMTEE